MSPNPLLHDAVEAIEGSPAGNGAGSGATFDLKPPPSPKAGQADGAVAGAARSFEQLRESYEHSYKVLYAQALRRLHSPEAAEDAVQQAFVDTAIAIERGTVIRNMGGWLSRCVYYLCLKGFSRPDELPLVGDIPSSRGADLTTDAAHARQSVEEIRRAVDRLPRNQRSAFLLAEVHGLSYAEVANALDKTHSSVRQLLSRARRQLEQIIGDRTSLHIQAYLSLQAHLSTTITKGREVGHLVSEKLIGPRSALASFFEQSAELITRPAAAALAAVAIAAGVTSAVTAPEGQQPPLAPTPVAQAAPNAEPVVGQPSVAKPPASSGGKPRPTPLPIGLVPALTPGSATPKSGAGDHLSVAPLPASIVSSPADLGQPRPGAPAVTEPDDMWNLPGDPADATLTAYPYPPDYEPPPVDEPGYEGPLPSGPGVHYRVCDEMYDDVCFWVWVGADGTVLVRDPGGGGWMYPDEAVPHEIEVDHRVQDGVQSEPIAAQPVDQIDSESRFADQYRESESGGGDMPSPSSDAPAVAVASVAQGTGEVTRTDDSEAPAHEEEQAELENADAGDNVEAPGEQGAAGDQATAGA